MSLSGSVRKLIKKRKERDEILENIQNNVDRSEKALENIKASAVEILNAITPTL